MQKEPAASTGGILMPSAFSEDDEALYEDAFGKKECRVGTIVAIGPGLTAEDGTRVPISNLEVGMTVVIDKVDGIKVEPAGKADRAASFYLYVRPFSKLFSKLPSCTRPPIPTLSNPSALSAVPPIFFLHRSRKISSSRSEQLRVGVGGAKLRVGVGGAKLRPKRPQLSDCLP